jgi:hypothetical protein
MIKIFKWVATMVAIIAGCITIYFAFHEERVKLNVEIISSENLTAHETIEDLSIKYYYSDTLEVHNLWKVQCVIRNTGDKTIVGTGTEKQILSDGLPIYFNKSEKNCRTLSARILNSNNEATLRNQKLYFQQWRRDEYVELMAFIESPYQPEVQLSDRDIVDSEISYSVYTPKREYRVIADHLPIWLNRTLKIIYVVFVVLFVIACLISLSTQNNDKTTKFSLLLVLVFLILPIIWLL